MAYYKGHSLYHTDCTYFNWKFVNYDKGISYGSFYSGGSRLYAPECAKQEAVSMFLRPVSEPCSGCPYYSQSTEKGKVPPGGYDV